MVDWLYREMYGIDFGNVDDDAFNFSGDDRVTVEELRASSSEYQQVSAKIRKTFCPSITKIIKVSNFYIEDGYNAQKEQYETRLKGAFSEMELFHVTAQTNVPSILRNNFDKGRTVRSKFGNGVSFSPDVAYANTYCNKSVGRKRAVIVTKVLVGKTHVGSQNLPRPMHGYDTTTGNASKVYVKYEENEFCPKYVVFYTY